MRLPSFRLFHGVLALFLVFGAHDAGAISIDMSDIRGSNEGPLGSALDLLGAGQPVEAEAVARGVIAVSPGSAAAYEILGVALARQDRVPEAIAALTRATELNPRQFTAWTKLGDIAQALDDEEKAASFYRRALEIAPDARLANQRLGLYLARHGEIEAAIRHLEKGIIGTPDDYLGVRVDLGRLYLRSGQPDRALDALARWEAAASHDGPIPAAALVVLGEAYLATGKLEKAVERFGSALDEDAGNVPALLGLGRAERARGRLEASIDALTRAAEAAPGEPAPQIELAASEAAAGQGEAATGRLDRLTAEGQAPDVETLAQAARLYGAMGLYEKARDRFERAILHAPDSPLLQAGMAAVLLRLGDNTGALDHARRWFELAPGDPNAAFLVGMLQEDAGDRAGAIASYEQALRLAPDHWPSLNNLAALQLAEGRSADALALAEHAAEVAPDNPTVLDTLANAQEKNGAAEQAAATRRRIAAMDSAADPAKAAQ